MLLIDSTRLKQIVPFASAFLIFLGSLKLTLYYRAFNIQINYFLEFTEIITAFFSDLIELGAMFLFVTLFTFLFDTESERVDRGKMQNLYINENKFFNRIKHAKLFIYYMFFFNLIFLITFLYFKYILIKFNPLINTLWIFLNLQLISTILLLEYKRKHFIIYNKRLHPSISNIILYVIIITFMLINRTFAEINSVKEGKKYYKTTFTLGNEKVVSDSLHYYIGKTRNFLFYYNEIENTTTAYSMTDIKSIVFHKK